VRAAVSTGAVTAQRGGGSGWRRRDTVSGVVLVVAVSCWRADPPGGGAVSVDVVRRSAVCYPLSIPGASCFGSRQMASLIKALRNSNRYVFWGFRCIIGMYVPAVAPGAAVIAAGLGSACFHRRSTWRS
jgi:hypothetical protein